MRALSRNCSTLADAPRSGHSRCPYGLRCGQRTIRVTPDDHGCTHVRLRDDALLLGSDRRASGAPGLGRRGVRARRRSAGVVPATAGRVVGTAPACRDSRSGGVVGRVRGVGEHARNGGCAGRGAGAVHLVRSRAWRGRDPPGDHPERPHRRDGRRAAHRHLPRGPACTTHGPGRARVVPATGHRPRSRCPRRRLTHRTPLPMPPSPAHARTATPEDTTRTAALGSGPRWPTLPGRATGGSGVSRGS